MVYFDFRGLKVCVLDQPVPKVFPDDAPVRDTPTIPKIISDQQPITQQCSFFQKMMENARSILSMKCQCPSATAKSTRFETRIKPKLTFFGLV